MSFWDSEVMQAAFIVLVLPALVAAFLMVVFFVVG